MAAVLQLAIVFWLVSKDSMPESAMDLAVDVGLIADGSSLNMKVLW